MTWKSTKNTCKWIAPFRCFQKEAHSNLFKKSWVKEKKYRRVLLAHFWEYSYWWPPLHTWLWLTKKYLPSVLCTMQKLSEIGFCRVKNGCFMGGHFFLQNFSKLNQQQPELLKGAECANDTKFNKWEFVFFFPLN